MKPNLIEMQMQCRRSDDEARSRNRLLKLTKPSLGGVAPGLGTRVRVAARLLAELDREDSTQLAKRRKDSGS